MTATLRVDPEFQSRIPPMTDAEFRQLEENILACGEVREALVTWNGVIVDGHNRWKVILEHPELKWRSMEMQFKDKWEAFDWMYKNQLGRRNLTDEQREEMIGKAYEVKKHMHGGDRRSQEFSSAGKRPLKTDRDGVSKILAEELGIGKTHVKDAYQYSKGIDAIRNEDPDLADSILTGKKKVRKQDVRRVGRAEAPDRKDMIEKIRREERIEEPKEREEMKEISKVANDLFAPAKAYEYSVDNLVRDIRNNCAPFVNLLTKMVRSQKELCAQNRALIIDTINECTTMKIKEIEEEIRRYE